MKYITPDAILEHLSVYTSRKTKQYLPFILYVLLRSPKRFFPVALSLSLIARFLCCPTASVTPLFDICADGKHRNMQTISISVTIA